MLEQRGIYFTVFFAWIFKRETILNKGGIRLIVFLYIASVVLANVITAATQPLALGVFLIPTGTFIVGATFVFRDMVQIEYGRKTTYMFIFLAFLISGVLSFILGDPLNILFASVLAFLVSETIDTEIFTRVKGRMEKRIILSGVVGGMFDSALFVIIGLSPLGAGFIPWEAVGFAIVGQMIVKTMMQFIGALSYKYFIVYL